MSRFEIEANRVVGITQLRGRDGPLDTVLARLAQLRSGAGSVVVIEGGAGFGKTRLLMEAFAAHPNSASGAAMAWPIRWIVWSNSPRCSKRSSTGDPPLFDRNRLSDQHAAPEQRFWLLREMEALLQAGRDPGAGTAVPR